MRFTLLATVSALTLAMAVPAFADTMDRDGGPTGKIGAPQLSHSQYYAPHRRGFFVTGRSVSRDRQIYVDPSEER